MNKIIPLVFISILLLGSAHGQTDAKGSGRALHFDAVDDYIDMGNIYDDVTFPLTISAWVYVEPSAQYILPIFVSQDNAPLYNGFWFCLSQSSFFFEYGDGRGENSSVFRKGKTVPVINLENRWMHLCAVVRSASDIQLYVNGYNVGGSYTGDSSLPMASDFPSDVAKIGYYHTNSVTHRFKGMIDELRVWNRALPESEIRQTMCLRLSGSESGLIGYWNFDETGGNELKDLSARGFHGALQGNPQRVFSGAPIGEQSVFLYSSDWTGKTLSLEDLTVTRVAGNPYGVHVYNINQSPSQTGGLDVSGIQLPYYGVFLADNGEDHVFDFTFSEDICMTYQRRDNSEPTWFASEIFSGIRTRAEMIRGFEQADLQIDLGGDVDVCSQDDYWLQPDGGISGRTFSWSTGATTPGISVTASGVYWVSVSEGCQADVDSVEVSFHKTPPAFSLGKDEELCSFEPRVLAADFDIGDYFLTWQDGSGDSTFSVSTFGTYWLKVQNACGVQMDSITFTQKQFDDIETYNFMSPDPYDDFNRYFVVDERLEGCRLSVFNRWGKQVHTDLAYGNDWDGNSLPPGVYFYTLEHECISPIKGTITIMK